MDFVSSNSRSNTNEADTTASGVSTAHTQGTTVNSTSVDNLSDAVICAFLASQPNSPQLVKEDLEQIKPDDLEEMDLHWEVAMLTIRARRFMKRTGRNLDMNGRRIGFDKGREYGRKTVPVETPTKNALIAQDGIGGDVKTVESKHKTVDVNHKDVFSTEEPKPIMKNNFSPPIIEDWHSDDESKIEISPTVESASLALGGDGNNPNVEQVKKRAKWDNDDYACRGLILNDSRLVMEQYNKRLGILRRFTQHKMNMDETIQVSCIIDKLPPFWKDFKHTLKYLKEELTLVELGSHLCIKKSLRVQDSDKPKGNNVIGPSVVNMMCGKPGQLKKDCKASNVGNKANGSGTKGSMNGSSNSLKGQNMFNKSFQDDPKTFDEVMKSLDDAFWKEAINDEIDFIMGNNTWELSDLLPGYKLLFGLDYFDTYALVALISTIRLMIAMVLIHNLIIHRMDVKTTFLNDELDKEVLKKFNYFDYTRVSTPMDTSEKLMPNNGEAVSQLEYSRVIGCLMYAITCTRPDIAFAVGKQRMYTSNLGTQQCLEGHADASWISNIEDNSSTSGRVFFLGGDAISWASKKQTCITGLIMKFEFMALAAAGKEAE
nr:zinc finger, CCHC-type [Tanacetum cinerariifolium]